MQRPFVHPKIEDVSLEGVLYALADPARLSIVRELTAAKCAMNCNAASPTDLPKATRSHHYRVLREAGIIRSERRGTEVINVLRAEEIDARFPGVVCAILRASATRRA